MSSSDKYSLTVAHPNSLLSAGLMALTRLETNSVPDSRATLTFSYNFYLRASDPSSILSTTWRELSNCCWFPSLLQVYCSRRALLTACSTEELFSLENRFAKSLSQDSICYLSEVIGQRIHRFRNGRLYSSTNRRI